MALGNVMINSPLALASIEISRDVLSKSNSNLIDEGYMDIIKKLVKK